jgi:type II secretory pathway pseudopilin PulG
MDSMRNAVPPTPTLQRPLGFSLIELAMVLFIVSLLIGGLLMPLSAQRDIRARGETERLLSEAREQVIGFAAAQQRLPCPATASSGGLELFCSNESGACTETTTYPNHGRCAHPYDGFLPAASLGFAPIDSSGFAVDDWGSSPSNRIRYVVTDLSYTPLVTTSRCQSGGVPGVNALRPFTCTDGMREAYPLASVSPDLRICNAGAGVQNPDTATADCTVNNALATDVAAIVYSLGKNAPTGGTSDDERHNPNPQTTTADRAFVRGPSGNSFDDQLLWISRSMLYGRMVSAGRLP